MLSLCEIPAGRWIVGVSGGADSVALLQLAMADARLSLHVAHLNHETRGAESDGDAEFVATLARSLSAPFTIARLSDIVPAASGETEFRAARTQFFTTLAAAQRAEGVLLAHHADDRAETVLLRLLRGGEASALGGLRREARVGGLHVLRPLLDARRSSIESYLRGLGRRWREDHTNRSPRYARNRVRAFLRTRPELVPALLQAADAADRLRTWTIAITPTLATEFHAHALADLPDPLARAAARRWLIARGAPANEVSAATAEYLIKMARDRSMPTKHNFPGGVAAVRGKDRFSVSAFKK